MVIERSVPLVHPVSIFDPDSLGTIENLWENAALKVNSCNLVVCRPKATTLETYRLFTDVHKC